MGLVMETSGICYGCGKMRRLFFRCVTSTLDDSSYPQNTGLALNRVMAHKLRQAANLPNYVLRILVAQPPICSAELALQTASSAAAGLYPSLAGSGYGGLPSTQLVAGFLNIGSGPTHNTYLAMFFAATMPAAAKAYTPNSFPQSPFWPTAIATRS